VVDSLCYVCTVVGTTGGPGHNSLTGFRHPARAYSCVSGSTGISSVRRRLPFPRGFAIFFLCGGASGLFALLFPSLHFPSGVFERNDGHKKSSLNSHFNPLPRETATDSTAGFSARLSGRLPGNLRLKRCVSATVSYPPPFLESRGSARGFFGTRLFKPSGSCRPTCLAIQSLHEPCSLPPRRSASPTKAIPRAATGFASFPCLRGPTFLTTA